MDTGEDLTICEFAEVVTEVVQSDARPVFDTSEPGATLRKLFGVSSLHDLDRRHSVTLDEGGRSTYEWYTRNRGEVAREM